MNWLRESKYARPQARGAWGGKRTAQVAGTWTPAQEPVSHWPLALLPALAMK